MATHAILAQTSLSFYNTGNLYTTLEATTAGILTFTDGIYSSTSILRNIGIPVNDTDVANKLYVSQLNNNLSWKLPVVASTTGSDITLSGGAPDTLDGVSLSLNDRILVKDQTTPDENGIYYVSVLGTGSDGTWVRVSDFDTGYSSSASAVIVQTGYTNASKFYYERNYAGLVGTDPINFSQLTGGAGTPGGSDMQIQYNDSSAFGGDASFTYNKSVSNPIVIIGGDSSATDATLYVGAGTDTNGIISIGTGAGSGSINYDGTNNFSIKSNANTIMASTGTMEIYALDTMNISTKLAGKDIIIFTTNTDATAGNINIYGGAGINTGTGGSINLISGSGIAPGNLNFVAGSSLSATTTGGSVNILAGSGAIGGSISLIGGFTDSDISGSELHLYGGAYAGNSGSVLMKSGANFQGGASGNLELRIPNGTLNAETYTGYSSGLFTIYAGNGGSPTTQSPSGVSTGGNGGSIEIYSGDGGNAYSASSADSQGGDGGHLYLTAGSGGNSRGFEAGKVGGSLNIISKSGGSSQNSTGGAGGDFVIQLGSGGITTSTSISVSGGRGGNIYYYPDNGGDATNATTSGIGGKGGSYIYDGSDAIGGSSTTYLAGAGGSYEITLGSGGSSSNSVEVYTGATGGYYSLICGRGGSNYIGGTGGSITMISGQGGDSTAWSGGKSGDITIRTSTGGTISWPSAVGGQSGSIWLSTGDGGSNANGIGGNAGTLYIQAGKGGSGSLDANGNGGSIVISGGDSLYTATAGNVSISPGSGYVNGELRMKINSTSADKYIGFYSVDFQDSSRIARLTGEGKWYATSFNATSDALLKENITPLNGSLDKINEIEAYKYNWKKEFINNSKENYGILAQQLEDIGLGNMVDVDNKGRKSVDYLQLLPILIGAVKELSKKVDNLVGSRNN